MAQARKRPLGPRVREAARAAAAAEVGVFTAPPEAAFFAERLRERPLVATSGVAPAALTITVDIGEMEGEDPNTSLIEAATRATPLVLPPSDALAVEFWHGLFQSASTSTKKCPQAEGMAPCPLCLAQERVLLPCPVSLLEPSSSSPPPGPLELQTSEDDQENDEDDQEDDFEDNQSDNERYEDHPLCRTDSLLSSSVNMIWATPTPASSPVVMVGGGIPLLRMINTATRNDPGSPDDVPPWPTAREAAEMDAKVRYESRRSH